MCVWTAPEKFSTLEHNFDDSVFWWLDDECNDTLWLVLRRLLDSLSNSWGRSTEKNLTLSIKARLLWKRLPEHLLWQFSVAENSRCCRRPICSWRTWLQMCTSMKLSIIVLHNYFAFANICICMTQPALPVYIIAPQVYRWGDFTLMHA